MAQGIALLAAACFGCAKAQPIAGDTRSCPTWQLGDLSKGTTTQMGQVFAKNCVSCHSPSGGPAGGYDLTSYLGVLGLSVPLDPNVAPSSVAVAGDPNSRLVTILQTPTDPIHAQFTGTDVAAAVTQWVGTCELPFFDSSVHTGGVLNPTASDFHGKLLQANGWDFAVCSSCHGADFNGGASGVSCTTCHTSPGGPTSCNTCHGLPPATGAHFTHVDGGALLKPLGCSQCHVVPAVYTDPGHLFDSDGGVITDGSVVTFGALAATPGYDRQGPPIFAPQTLTCSSVYCHGDTLGDTNATNTRPNWSAVGTGQAACGTCHGLPPSDHGSALTQCSDCHWLVVDANRNFVDPALHIDGLVSLGNGDGTCSACHGDSTSSAPPRDMEGNTSTSAIGVGAHRAHLDGLHQLSGPVQCGDCHLVPTTPGSAGHIDHNPPATVFPPAIASSSLAFADDAGPIEDHATATCSNVYCHGGGARMQDDKTPNLHRRPIWTESGAAACGTCHGIPPQDGTPGHSPGAGLSTCATCHAGTVDPSGAIIIRVLPDGGRTSLHIDGLVEADGGS